MGTAEAVNDVPPGEPPDERDRRLLAYLAAAGIASGLPAAEVEASVRRVGRHLGYPAVQVGVMPSGLHLALAPGQPATFETVTGVLRLDQGARVADITRALRTGAISPEVATERLASIRSVPHRAPVLGAYGGGVAIGLGLALILQPSVPSVLFALALSPVVVALIRLTGRGLLPPVLLPFAATFVTALAAFWAADQGWIDAPVRTLLPPVAALLPGAVIVTGTVELVGGSMASGSARLAHGATQLLMFATGVLGAAALLSVPPSALENVRAADFGLWSIPVGLVLVTLGIALMESVPPRLVPWTLLVLALTATAQLGLQWWFEALWAGGLGGAFVASLASSALAERGPGVPRPVTFLPSFWLLVPGSLGLVSVTQFGSSPSMSAGTMAAAGSLVLGIAVGMILGSGAARVLRPVSPDPAGGT